MSKSLSVESILPTPFGRVTLFRVPNGYALPAPGDPAEAWKDYHSDRSRWSAVARPNNITVFGKDFIFRFITRAVSRTTNLPWFTTSSLEQDDFLEYAALGSGGTGPPNPAAFQDPEDTIQAYRGRARRSRSEDVLETDAPHAVQVEYRFTGTDIYPAIADDAFSLNEVGLVPFSSHDHTGEFPGGKVVAYCTFPDEAIDVELEDEFVLRWILGTS